MIHAPLTLPEIAQARIIPTSDDFAYWYNDPNWAPLEDKEPICELSGFPDYHTPTYHYANGSSVLDLMFSSPQVIDLIGNWAVDEDNPTSSDHEMIKYEITADNDNQVLPPTTERWNWM